MKLKYVGSEPVTGDMIMRLFDASSTFNKSEWMLYPLEVWRLIGPTFIDGVLTVELDPGSPIMVLGGQLYNVYETTDFNDLLPIGDWELVRDAKG